MLLLLAVTITITGVVLGDLCGETPLSPVFGRHYIVGGSASRPHSWPWMVTLQSHRVGHFCGASLIDEHWVLTAAHCADFYKSRPHWITAGVGVHRLGQTEPPARNHTITAILIHEDYSSDTLNNDVALLRLEEPVVFSDQVRPVCLPVAEHSWPRNTQCVVTGWGLTYEEGIDANPTLLQVQVPLVEHEVCNGLAWLKGAVTPELQLCAGYDAGGKDTCQMDSGGPLVTQVNGRWQQAGVVSWGVGCARARRPGVYTNVAHFVPWIQAHMRV